MASIRFISSSRVCAASHNKPNLRIELTPWDLQLLLADYNQKGLLFHKPKPCQDLDNAFLYHLKTSLSRTLDFFPPLAGRLATERHQDNTTSYFIDCNNAGAEFVHAAVEGVSIADIIQPVNVPQIVDSFFPLNEAKNHEGTSQPLLAVQVTELVDGIFIACTINHAVVDGLSFWHFFNSWSEISRGFGSLSKPPVLQRWFLPDTHLPIHLPISGSTQVCNRIVPPPFQQRIFNFTRENIAKLKVKANAETGTDNISSLQALLSHFWRSAIRNKCVDPELEIVYRLLVDARSRLRPALPQEYFGNAIVGGTVTMKAGEVLEKGLGHVALQMNKLVALHTEEKIRNFFVSWIENPRLLTIGDYLNSTTLHAGSSPRFNVYGNDFGWGRPLAVRSGPGNKMEGKLTLFPGAKEGSVDIEACLLPETLQGMENDAEFMDAVTA